METEDSPSIRLIHALKRQIDELVVQLSLGKAEASDHIEQGKAALREKVTALREALAGEERHAPLAERLDHLRVQLALGAMESRDAYEEQRRKIQEAIDGVRENLHHLDERIRDDLSDASDTLQLKLNALALDLGIAAIVAEDELKTRKAELTDQASRLADRLKSAVATKGEEAESVAKEARAAFDDIRDNLRRLFH